MTDARRAMDLFEQALEYEPALRAAFLDRHCASDTGLRDEVEALLAAADACEGFLAGPLTRGADRSGERLGAYRLVRLIGSGGMGSVYRAERADKAYAKPVAIKLLLIDAGELRTRFALEQRILGGITHPNIASLLDVGSDDHGAPYLVMEYVEGEPITAYARRAGLDPAGCADLFLKILDAVQTAHSQLIVHRDLKPGNVLVDAHGEPKLLDFGIAKLVGDEAPGTTRTGLGPLTPNYASPEQVRGDPVGTGSDIYSLGMMLYELVTGELPYRIENTHPSAIERTVCDTDPPRPSTRIGLRGSGNLRDLDAIILKALEKSPRQRYASCSAFADDLRRWRGGEPVQARQPPVGERALRYLRRHRLAVSVAAAASLALLIGSAAALWQAHVADIARARAERVNRFLTDMLSAANPADLGRNASVLSVLERAQRLADRELVSDPETAATTQLTLMKTYAALGDWNAARACAEAALKAAQQVGDTATAIDAEIGLGEILVYGGNVDEARNALTRGREAALRHGNARQRATAAHILGRLENRSSGNLPATRRWFETALAEVPADDPDSHSYILNDLAQVKQLQGDNDGALALLLESVRLMRNTYPHGNPALAIALGQLGSGYAAAGQLEAAAHAHAETLSMQIDLLGENHPNAIMALASLSAVELKQGDVAAALAHSLRGANAAQTLPESDEAYCARAYLAYGNALIQARQPEEAIVQIGKTLAIYRKLLPADHRLIANAESALGLALALSGDVTAGTTLARAAHARLRDALGETSESTLDAQARLARIEALAGESQASHR